MLIFEPNLQDAFDCLRTEAASLFGARHIPLDIVRAVEREASKVLKVVVGAEGVDAIFLKVFKLREDSSAAREAVARACGA